MYFSSSTPTCMRYFSLLRITREKRVSGGRRLTHKHDASFKSRADTRTKIIILFFFLSATHKHVFIVISSSSWFTEYRTEATATKYIFSRRFILHFFGGDACSCCLHLRVKTRYNIEKLKVLLVKLSQKKIQNAEKRLKHQLFLVIATFYFTSWLHIIRLHPLEFAFYLRKKATHLKTRDNHGKNQYCYLWAFFVKKIVVFLSFFKNRLSSSVVSSQT